LVAGFDNGSFPLEWKNASSARFLQNGAIGTPVIRFPYTGTEQLETPWMDVNGFLE
jgi:hypothetical protein